jgi:hypothetical protein
MGVADNQLTTVLPNIPNFEVGSTLLTKAQMFD